MCDGVKLLIVCTL